MEPERESKGNPLDADAGTAEGGNAMKYIAQIMAVLNWMHERFWRWIFEYAVNGMGDDGFCNYGERKNGDWNG